MDGANCLDETRGEARIFQRARALNLLTGRGGVLW